MTPHCTLEDMALLEDIMGDRLAEFFWLGTWQSVKDTVEAAVHFEFGAATPLAEHVEFGLELMDRGLFRLPFPDVFYSAQSLGHSSVVASLTAGDGIFDLSLCSISPAVDRGTGKAYRSPGIVVRAHGPTWTDCTLDVAAAQRNGARHLSTGQPFTKADKETAAFRMLRFVVGATALLMSKDIETRIEPAPARLNAIRARKGRIAVGDRRVIKVKPIHRAAYAQAADEQRSGHASPRMHLRRGHFRTLSHERYGESRGLVIPVAPSIVNANDDAKPLAKTYQVEVA